MTANTTGEKYREEYDAYFNSIEDKNAVKTYEGWLESALAQSQKEAGELREACQYAIDCIDGKVRDYADDLPKKLRAALTQKEKT